MSLRAFMSVVLLTALAGCSGDATPSPAAPQVANKASQAAETDAESASDTELKNNPPARDFYKPISLGASEGSADSAPTSAKLDAPPKREDVVKGLQPIQKVLVGRWKGLVKNAAAQEDHQWLWDHKTDKVFPALVLKSPNGQFFVEARITFDPRVNKYLMQTVDKDQVIHKLEGEFVAEPQDVPGEDDKSLERTYKLELTELPAEGQNTRWRFLLNQQNNNRYLVEVSRSRGTSAFNMIDVIGTQREGTSFARSDSDYGEKTCIISEGLGTIQVSYQGRSFWVCCTGCKAAFEDDPKSWIAKFEERQKSKK